AGKGGYDQIKRIGGIATNFFRKRQWFDDIEKLKHRSWPAVCEKNDSAIICCRRVATFDVIEMNIDAVDIRHKLRKTIQALFLLAPVEFVEPVIAELTRVVESGATAPAAGVGQYVPAIIANALRDAIENVLFYRNGIRFCL